MIANAFAGAHSPADCKLRHSPSRRIHEDRLSASMSLFLWLEWCKNFALSKIITSLIIVVHYGAGIFP
jgi:hypothetical protein